ncbi:hypothetical protein CLIB1423_11S00584 [[Candida] railenensis]|uniref:Uncharacterized protein n=1 Tax=[Candida] railenensis TaxID=45579 RepID=A0A9P0QR82_9ASCO|nr:hypothetical protein CLIB1423_11S00584 [[Candida] railenensis]
MRSMFAHPWWAIYNQIGEPMKTLDEWVMIEICNSIREKSDWKTKYKNEEISSKWKAEIKESFQSKTENLGEIIAYVFKELQWIEYLEHTFPGVEAKDFHVGIDDRIVYSDQAIDPETKSELAKAVERFSSKEFKDGYDYHPGSNNQVVDLVHPSLYPLQYGKTPVFTNKSVTNPWEFNSMKSEERNRDRTLGIAQYDDSIAKVKKSVQDFGISKAFQWLPAKLAIDHTHKYSFKSYINNLHPKKYDDLYSVIAKVIDLSTPGINLCLSRYSTGPFSRIQLPAYESWATEEWQKKYDEIQDPPPDPETGEEVDPDWDALEEFEETKKDNFRKFPPVWENDPPVNYAFDIKNNFDDLKVIVKLANIELTPERPNYNGGSWHVEGTINEDIIATLIYYYDCENISESSLSFKTAYEDPHYEQSDSAGVEKFYGLSDEDSMTKVIGKMETKEDRVLIFPNWFQHHVDPFELSDKTKPGHRKILCLFIVDPYNEKVLSTDMVPPQQKEWWTDGTDLSKFGLNEFVKEEILKLKAEPVSLAEVKSVRDQLMKERSVPEIDEHDYTEMPFERKFSLCEH